MKWLDQLEGAIRHVATLGACILIPAQLVVSITYVVGRRLFNVPITPLQELEWHFFFALVFLTLGAALLADRHVRIDIVRDRLSPRSRAWIEIVGFVIALLPFCAALIYFGTTAAWESFLIGERSRVALGLPWRWIIKSFVPLGGLLLLLSGIVVTGRNVEVLLSKRGSERLAGARRERAS